MARVLEVWWSRLSMNTAAPVLARTSRTRYAAQTTSGQGKAFVPSVDVRQFATGQVAVRGWRERPKSAIDGHVVQCAITGQQRRAVIQQFSEDLHIGNAGMSGGQEHELDRMTGQSCLSPLIR